jgi:predicted nucleic acid-binding protein
MLFWKALPTWHLIQAPLFILLKAILDMTSRYWKFFSRIDLDEISGVTSMITLCEVLVHPLSNNNTDLYTQYCELLPENPRFTTVPITSEIAKRASMFRANYGFRTPDALQLAAAVEVGCEAFLTGDKKLSRITEIKVIQLEEIGK